MDTKTDYESQKLLQDGSVERMNIARGRPNAGLALIGIAVLACLQVVLNSFSRIAPVPIISDLKNSKNTSWDWAAVLPSRDLKWHKCYDRSFDCARLDVSLPISSIVQDFCNQYMGRYRWIGSIPRRKSVL